jgi:hypothetical protein
MTFALRYDKTMNILGYAFTFILKMFIPKTDDAPRGRKQVAHL